MEVVEKFVDLKKRLELRLERKTAFLFYSRNGFSKDQETLLRDEGIMYTTLEKLTTRS